MSKLDTAEEKRFRLRLAAIRALSPLPDGERHRYDLKSIQRGGYFSLQGENWQVRAMHRYQETKWDFQKDKRYTLWELEIFSLKSAQVRHIEWGVDDDLEIFLAGERLKFRDLTDDQDRRVGKADLDRLADAEGGIKYQGKTYWYNDDESWAAKFYRNNQGSPERVRFYEFATKNDDCLTIEAWYDEADRECEIWTSREVDTHAIRILQLQGVPAP
ncbi:MAG: DUF4178 domain-containing protein [Magnetococcales bacterium]|nr:DUF4178 domain-containing protein [Magnetococcales bacterium]